MDGKETFYNLNPYFKITSRDKFNEPNQIEKVITVNQAGLEEILLKNYLYINDPPYKAIGVMIKEYVDIVFNKE